MIDDRTVVMASGRNSLKARNIQRDPRVALVVTVTHSRYASLPFRHTPPQ